MEDEIIDTIYELKRDINVCKEMIEKCKTITRKILS